MADLSYSQTISLPVFPLENSSWVNVRARANALKTGTKHHTHTPGCNSYEQELNTSKHMRNQVKCFPRLSHVYIYVEYNSLILLNLQSSSSIKNMNSKMQKK